MGWQDDALATAEPRAIPKPWDRDSVVSKPAANEALNVTGSLKQHFEGVQARAADSFEDYINAGFQQSVTGLSVRKKMPDVAITADTPWYGRFISNATSMLGDAPAMVPGFFAGEAAGSAIGAAAGSAVPVIGTAAGTAGGAVIGGFAGASALPAALRTVMMDAYSRGEIHSSADFIDRALHVAWETSKAALVGGATGVSGIAGKAILPVAAPVAMKVAVPTAAQVVTMTTVGKALEGELPEPQDFLDAAIVIGGIQGVAGAASVAGRLRTIYAKTGVRPEQVVADVAQDPALKQEILSEATPERAVPIEQTVAQVAREWNIPSIYAPQAAAETARAIVPGEKAVQVARSPFADELPQVKGEPAQPTHVNYDYINTADDTKLALARISEVYEKDIQKQRRGTVSWEETSNEAAKLLSDTLGGADMRLLMPREPGTPAGAAEILARKQLVVGAAEDMMRVRDNLIAKGADATMEDRLALVAAVERTAMIGSEMLGARAEAGRAMNILKSTAMEAERVKQIQGVLDMYGKDPVKLAEMMKQLDSPAAAMKFAKEAVKATTWEKMVEAWKAAILSGPKTHMANILGNGVFAAIRAPIDLVASGIGAMRSGEERVSAMEPVARVVGAVQGTMDGLRLAIAILKTGEQPGKAEQPRTAISGMKGEVIRLPFRFLSAEDAVFSTMNKRAESYTLAVREATKEGLNPLTREFRERVAQIVDNPTPEMAAAIDAVGDRFTFNTPLGEKGRAVQEFVRKWNLQWAVPFIRTPANVFEELFRMTPLAPLMKEWRSDFAKGGVAKDKALAELAVGTGIMSAVFMKALDGSISGSGEPDQGKKRVQQAAGWQPYSVKAGDTWYNYQRLQPIGTLVGMAADVAEVWDHLNEEEKDRVPKMLSVAFANAVTNQTFLQGITNIVNAMSDPARFGPRLAQQYAGSAVPAIVAQPTAMFDPVVREVDSIVDAVKSRLPSFRGDLLPQRDVFGEPIKTKESLGGIFPVTESKESNDKVRTEAARLGISISDAPKKTHVGRGSGKLGDVKLEPEQRDRFQDVAGHLAHDVLEQMVNSAGWDDLPDIVKKRAYAKVFLQAHRAGAAAALPPDLRAGVINEITEKITTELAPADQ